MDLNPNYYSEQEPVLGTRNMWEYYFSPVSAVSPADAYRSGNWTDSGGVFPFQVMNPLFSGEMWLRETYDRYVRPRSETELALAQARASVEVGPGVLGVHFRGTDMRTSPGHPLPPLERQMFRKIDERLNQSHFDTIFLATEADTYVANFVARYGKRVTYLDIPRVGDINIFVEYPRPHHRYLLGLEAFIESKLLAECGGLVCGYSGLSEMAHALGRDDFTSVEKIWNGRVPGTRLAAKHFWSYRSVAPRILGGFRT